ncbi:hypothetical protein CPB86DRAFT_141668 [Serendipita vermifera]|nr:hypothetical protein CPB86DRAFT_141668 [Serendipita vermifera]
MRGTAIRNSRLFKNISGDDPLKSAVTAPNVWQSSPSMALGIVRPEMAKGPDFFTRVTHAPSMIHANTRGSSSSILSLLLVEDRREILVRIGSDKPWLEQTLAASMGSPLLDTKKKSMERSACMESAPENSARFQTTLNAAFSSLPAHVTTHSTHHSGSSIQIQNTHFTTQEAPIVSHIPTRKAREDRDFKAPDLGDVAGIQRGDEEEESAMRVIRSPPPAQATTGSTRYSSSPSRMQDPEGGYLIARDESVKAKDSGTLTLEDGGNIQRHDVTKKFARGAILSSAPKQNTTPPMHRSGTASQAQDIQSYHLIGVGRPMTSIGFTAPVLEGDTRVQIHDNMTETAKRIIPSSIQLKARTQSTSLLSPPIQMGDTPNYHPTVATEPMKGEDFWKAALKEIYQHDGAKESAEYIVPSSAPAQDTTQPTDRSGSPSRTQSTQSYYLIA